MGKKCKTDMVYPSRRSPRLEAVRNKSAKEIHVKEAKLHRKFEREYWNKSGFDVDYPAYGMEVFKCKRKSCPLLVKLYAKMGLHRYNMIQGTDLQLHHIEKYNMDQNAIFISVYYITLVAWNPATGSLVPFQTRIHERKRNQTDVMCSVARVKDKGTKGTAWGDDKAPDFYNISVPKWPEDDALADQDRLYVVPESEWQENDWISLYLELAFVTTNRRIPNLKLSDLKIVEVMVENVEKVQPPNAELKGFRDAIVYIKYDQDLGEGGVCKRRAIFRRSVDLRSERMSLMGDDYLESKTDSEHEASSISSNTGSI